MSESLQPCPEDVALIDDYVDTSFRAVRTGTSPNRDWARARQLGRLIFAKWPDLAIKRGDFVVIATDKLGIDPDFPMVLPMLDFDLSYRFEPFAVPLPVPPVSWQDRWSRGVARLSVGDALENYVGRTVAQCEVALARPRPLDAESLETLKQTLHLAVDCTPPEARETVRIVARVEPPVSTYAGFRSACDRVLAAIRSERPDVATSDQFPELLDGDQLADHDPCD